MSDVDFAASPDWMTLAEACNKLGKARSTLMRLLPRWEAVTSYKPRKDHSGRWFIPVQSVQELVKDPELYLRLANRATKWNDELDRLRKENRRLRERIQFLELNGTF